jgi:hypothetical protein
VEAMPTIGWWRWSRPADPWKVASPDVKTPPSDATRHAPLPVGVAAIPTMGALSDNAPIEADGMDASLTGVVAAGLLVAAGWAAPDWRGELAPARLRVVASPVAATVRTAA